MRNIVLEKIASLFLRVMLIISVWLLFRGHHEPGGGFIAGIIASTGFIFYAIVFGSVEVERILRWNTRNWMASGLLLILIAMLIPVLLGDAPMKTVWVMLPGGLHVGTPFLFEIGVYIAVIGVILSIIITIMEVLRWNS